MRTSTRPHFLKISLKLILIAFMIMAPAMPVFSQDRPTQITIRVDGLTCPFCAYGLEKKLKRLEGAESVRIDIERGIAVISVAKGKSILEENLRKAVQNAGFTPRKITYPPSQEDR